MLFFYSFTIFYLG